MMLAAASVSAQQQFGGERTKSMLGENGHGQRNNKGSRPHNNDAFMNVMDANHDGQLTKTELNYGFDKIADKVRD